LEGKSNVIDASDLQEEKQYSQITSIDDGILIEHN
jgi:hypothetical protein